MTANAIQVSVVYDGQCPVCSYVVGVARLRDRAGALELIDARTEPVVCIQGRNLSALNFDEGFAVVVDGAVHHGADAAQVLSALTQPSGLGYRLFRWLVATERRSGFWYPVLRFLRGVLLKVLRVPKINDT